MESYTYRNAFISIHTIKYFANRGLLCRTADCRPAPLDSGHRETAVDTDTLTHMYYHSVYTIINYTLHT